MRSPSDFSIAALWSQPFTRSTHFSSVSDLRKIVPAERFGPLSAVHSLQWSTTPLGRRLSAAPQRKRLRQQLAFCIISEFQQTVRTLQYQWPQLPSWIICEFKMGHFQPRSECSAVGYLLTFLVYEQECAYGNMLSYHNITYFPVKQNILCGKNKIIGL